MIRRPILGAWLLMCTLGLASTASAQPPATDRKWSVDFGIGFDKGISGNVNSGAIGVFNEETTAVLKNQYADVYGTGLHLRFGGGYRFRELTEVRVTFTFQSLDGDLVRMGDVGISPLYGQYADYQSFGMDVGVRRYFSTREPKVKLYGEGTMGLAFVDEIEVELAAPAAGIIADATDFYDRTAAFTVAINGGVTMDVASQFGVFFQLGIRYVTGLSEVDQFVGTGLESINDSSARWALPISGGIRFVF